MDSKVNYILVGLFVLLLSAALIGGVLWFSSGVQSGYRDYVVFTGESVSGLNEDAAVRYRGVKVGRVADITLAPGDPTRVRLLLSISPETPVKTDTVATLEMQGVTGLMNVNLTGGSKEAKPLTAPAGQVPVIPSKPSLVGQISNQAEALALKLNETSDRINRLLGDQNQVAISQTLANLEKVTSALATESQTIADTLIELRQTMRGARAAGEELPATVQQFRESAAALERMAKEVIDASKSVRTEVTANGNQMRRFMGDTLPNAGSIVEELRETAANLRRASETLERDPSVLVYGGETHPPGPGE